MWRFKSPGVPKVELDLVREELSSKLKRVFRGQKIHKVKLVQASVLL